MVRGRVLLIAADEWVTKLVSKFLSDAGYLTDVAGSARAGFDRAVATLPDMVMVDVALPDVDGYWVTKRIRSEQNRLGSTPILLVSQKEDPEARLEGLALGADVFLAAPFKYEELIAQVEALMGMARRLQAKRDSIHADAVPSAKEMAFQGDLAQISIATTLTMLEMERRTGRLDIKAESKPLISIDLVDGAVACTRKGKVELEAIRVLREAVTWMRGTASFTPGQVESKDRPRRPTGMLLLEAIRLNDEARRK